MPLELLSSSSHLLGNFHTHDSPTNYELPDRQFVFDKVLRQSVQISLSVPILACSHHFALSNVLDWRRFTILKNSRPPWTSVPLRSRLQQRRIALLASSVAKPQSIGAPAAVRGTIAASMPPSCTMEDCRRLILCNRICRECQTKDWPAHKSDCSKGGERPEQGLLNIVTQSHHHQWRALIPSRRRQKHKPSLQKSRSQQSRMFSRNQSFPLFYCIVSFCTLSFSIVCGS